MAALSLSSQMIFLKDTLSSSGHVQYLLVKTKKTLLQPTSLDKIEVLETYVAGLNLSTKATQ